MDITFISSLQESPFYSYYKKRGPSVKGIVSHAKEEEEKKKKKKNSGPFYVSHAFIPHKKT
jgi:hypothetical protein